MEENIVRVQSQPIEIVQEKLILNEIGRALEDTFKHLVVRMQKEFISIPDSNDSDTDALHKIHLCDIKLELEIQNWDIRISMEAKQPS